MWLSKQLVGIFQVAKESVDDLRIQLATTKAECDLLKEQLRSTKIMSDFLRVQVNQLQLERAGLLEKAYGIKTQVPEVMRVSTVTAPNFEEFSFSDVGDEVASKLGLPIYGDTKQ